MGYDMNFIVKPTKGKGWLAARSDYDKRTIAEYIYHSDVLVSDLDDTVAKSPIRDMIELGSKDPKYYYNPLCSLWAIPAYCIWKLWGKRAEPIVGWSFTRFFLRIKSVLKQVTERYTPAFAESSLYDGVSDFYQTLPEEMTKIFITRNIEQIADAYTEATGFDYALYEQYDKRKSIEKILSTNPTARSFLVIGDSKEDEEILELLRAKREEKQIDSVLGIYVTDPPKHLNTNFDINIGKDYGGLVKLMKKYPSH